MGTLHDRSSREANVAATVTAAQNPRPAGKTERFSSRLAIGADKPIPPPHLLQICGARSIIREQPLEFGQRPRKRQVTPLQNVHARHHPPSCPSLHILQVVGMGDNRIGKRASTKPGRVCPDETAEPATARQASRGFNEARACVPGMRVNLPTFPNGALKLQRGPGVCARDEDDGETLWSRNSSFNEARACVPGMRSTSGAIETPWFCMLQRGPGVCARDEGLRARRDSGRFVASTRPGRVCPG